jgi:hypothetical protein
MMPNGHSDYPANDTEELPIVQGRMVQGEIRVDEAELEPGRYRVEFGGRVVGEVKVTDPIIGHKSNRIDRRRAQSVRKHRLPAHPLGGLIRRSR